MRIRTAFLLLIIGAVMVRPTDIAHSETEWGSVAEGIDFQQFVLPGPNRAFVARMDRSSPNVIVDSTVAQGKLYEGTETVSGMAERYDDTIVGWGSRWDATGKVAVAINGIFYDPSTGIPQSGQIQGGWYIKRFEDHSGGVEFGFNRDREGFIGGCAMHPDDEQWVYFLDRGKKLVLGGINIPQNTRNIVIYTPQYDFHTHTGNIVSYADNAGATSRHPRTAVCLNNEYTYFIVVDGRQTGYSIGMTSNELARFCRDRLGATWGINQDGGGSSAMWLDGEIVNRPSDGRERLVANGLTMVVLEPVQKSTVFEVGEPLRTTRAAELRVGPGDNYAAFTTIHDGDPGIVVSHINGLNGVHARGTNWWRVAFENKWGWMAEGDLEAEQSWIGLWKGVHDKVLRSDGDSSSDSQPVEATP